MDPPSVVFFSLLFSTGFFLDDGVSSWDKDC